jgi:glycolate oxidase iron-sulfur subunit
MQTQLSEDLRDTDEGARASAILRACVHCGFCNATCPTYRLTGDELDGPRGRIYLMKQVLEGTPAGPSTLRHLDRCLTCRHCETTCPSGVRYGELLEIGRAHVAAQVPRPLRRQGLRALLRIGLTSPLFAPLMALARVARPWLPTMIAQRVPRAAPRGVVPDRVHARRVLLPVGCVQPAMLPNVDAATIRVLDRLHIGVVRPVGARCCGAVRQHLDDPAGALVTARANIDAWWPAIEAGVEAIVSNASACGLEIKAYGERLAGDPTYAARAERVSALARDLGEFLWAERAALGALVPASPAAPVAFHAPCTLVHGQRRATPVEDLLRALGAPLQPVAEQGSCCGSAGTYSILEPTFAERFRTARLRALEQGDPADILSANVGCIAHLAAGTTRSVRHWIEWVDERAAPQARAT